MPSPATYLDHRNPTFRAHVGAHEQVIGNESWYGDGKPSFGKSFTAKRTAERQAKVINILQRAARRAGKAEDKQLAETYYQLAEKLRDCGPRHRCGSLACPKCARAFQKAKVAAQKTLVKALAKSPDKKMVFVTIIPKGMTYYPGNFWQIDIAKANRGLKDAIQKARIDRVVFGSADLSWETTRRGGGYLQLHWHLAMWTNNRRRLRKKLKSVFQPARKYERPIDVSVTTDLRFLAYMNKKIKLPELLRRARRRLPELSLLLDRTDPLELMVISKLRLNAQGGGLSLRQI